MNFKLYSVLFKMSETYTRRREFMYIYKVMHTVARDTLLGRQILATLPQTHIERQVFVPAAFST